MSITQVQQMQRRAAGDGGRKHDYIYDPVHFLSSERDHARATFKAHTSTDRLKRLPVFPTMFSDLRHCPRTEMRMDFHDPLPKSVPRQWRGYADQAREALVRYKQIHNDPTIQIPPKQYSEAQPEGRDRALYFRRPIIPYMPSVPPDVVLAASRPGSVFPHGGLNFDTRRIQTPGACNVATQTDYRDSEVQTEPYTPEYVVRPGSAPEILTLATLSYGRGLPAGLSEVEMIERARVKRRWEAALPPLNDVTQLDRRRRMMDEMERQEWAHREKEIEKLQEARLEVLLKLLKQREENHEELNNKRLDRLWARKQKEKEEKFKKIRYEHIKSIRKLTRYRKNVEGRLECRDIISDYDNPSSQAYAPLTRIGVFLDRGSEQFNFKSRYLQSYEGLTELENSLPNFVLQPRVKAPKPKTVTKAGFIKRKYRRENELAELHQDILEKQEIMNNVPNQKYIKELKNKQPEEKKKLRFLVKIEKAVVRPPTPGVEAPPEESENRDLAVVFLQQLIRGRAVQAMMYEGKEKRRELIAEVRSTHALQAAELDIKKHERQGTLAMQRQRRLLEHKESIIEEGLAEMEGGSLGGMLDFLSKELIRLQEERRIHAFAMLAERQRRIREAEESGRRQVEMRRRREEDEIFKQVVKVHQDCVDTYLEDVIMTGLDKTSDEISRQEIHQVAETVNKVAYDLEENRDQLMSEEISAELVHQFLIPEVQRKAARAHLAANQRKYLLAAHKEIFSGSAVVMEDETATNQGKTDLTKTDQAVQFAENLSEEVIAAARQTILDEDPQVKESDTNADVKEVAGVGENDEVNEVDEIKKDIGEKINDEQDSEGKTDFEAKVDNEEKEGDDEIKNIEANADKEEKLDTEAKENNDKIIEIDELNKNDETKEDTGVKLEEDTEINEDDKDKADDVGKADDEKNLKDEPKADDEVKEDDLEKADDETKLEDKPKTDEVKGDDDEKEDDQN